MFDFGGVAVELQGCSACFFCLGVSAASMNKIEYTRLTYDLTLGWAKVLARSNPAMTFIYVSGAGTGGKAMWAQVKGRTENALPAYFLIHTCFVWQRCAQCTGRYQKRVGRGSATPSFTRCYRLCERLLRERL